MATMTSRTVFLLIFLQNLSMSHSWGLADRLMGNRPVFRRTLTRRYEQNPSMRQRKQDLADFIERPVESLVGDLELPPKTTPEQDELADFVRCIAKAADDRKGEDIVAYRVSHISTLTSFLVIVSGNSRPQNQAIAKSILDAVDEEYGTKPGGGVPEGNAESGWILLDYGSVMVHIMAPKSRLFYNVEGQWKDKGGQPMDLSDILVPNTIGGTMNTVAPIQEDDPFWS